MNPKRGEIWLVDFGMPRGYEQAEERPAVIIQNDDLSKLSTVVVVPATTVAKYANQRGAVLLPFVKEALDKRSIALCYQIRAVDCHRLKKRLGKLPETALADIDSTVAYVLGIAI